MLRLLSELLIEVLHFLAVALKRLAPGSLKRALEHDLAVLSFSVCHKGMLRINDFFHRLIGQLSFRLKRRRLALQGDIFNLRVPITFILVEFFV